MKTQAKTGSSSKKLPKPNNVFVAPLDDDFFKRWCTMLRPFVPLTNREVDLLASLLKHRWELSKYISDPAILDNQLMSDAMKQKIIADCNITLSYFYVLMSGFKKNKVIVNGMINPRMIPRIVDTNSDYFQLLILFKKPEKNKDRNGEEP